jgi:hypothetical protein
VALAGPGSALAAPSDSNALVLGLTRDLAAAAKVESVEVV